jgi:hypothetical protein
LAHLQSAAMKLCAKTPRSIFAAIVAASVVLALASAAGAQTLSEPAPKPKWTPPPNAAKSHAAAPAARVKTCAAYGAGFAQVPGTDACIKIGGFVEGTVSAGH